MRAPTISTSFGALVLWRRHRLFRRRHDDSEQNNYGPIRNARRGLPHGGKDLQRRISARSPTAWIHSRSARFAMSCSRASASCPSAIDSRYHPRQPRHSLVGCGGSLHARRSLKRSSSASCLPTWPTNCARHTPPCRNSCASVLSRRMANSRISCFARQGPCPTRLNLIVFRPTIAQRLA